MNYIVKKGSFIYVDGEIINTTLRKFLNDLPKPYFKTIISIRETVRTKLNIKRNIPLYISKEILLVPINIDDGRYFINFNKVKETYTKDKTTTILFNDCSSINLNISKRFIDRINKNVEKLRDYISLID